MATTPVTRTSLLARVAVRANTSGYADTTTLGGEVSQLVDVSLAKMHNLLVGLYEDYFTKTYNMNIVSGQDTYTLPSDFFKLRQVFYVDSSGYRSPISRLEISDLSNVPVSGGSSSGPVGYVLMNNSLVMYPKPSSTSANALLLFYVPEYTPPDNDATPIEYQIAFGWDEWVVNDVVVQIRNKAMMPTDGIIGEREKLEAMIRHQARQRNAGDPPRVRDIGWGSSQPYSRWGQFAIK